MPSSTSSSELPTTPHKPYQREVPNLRLGTAWIVALILLLLGVIGWEAYWRAFGARPTTRNSDGLWAMQRRRVSEQPGNKAVIIGSSRALFDIQLSVWEKMLGEKPIQLALEGTSPLYALEDLADDPKFTGRLLVGVTPPLLFTGFGRRRAGIEGWNKETPSDRISQWLSMHLVEPFFAFYDPDFALMKIAERQDLPERPGVPNIKDVRRISVQDRHRNTRLWEKVETDPGYQATAKYIWKRMLMGPPPFSPEEGRKIGEEQMRRTIAAVKKLQGRGVEVVFLRPPSAGPFLEFENKVFPRHQTWDVLLRESGSRGIHFEDYPAMQTYKIPEWSHISAADAVRFTEDLCGILQQEFGWKKTGSG